MNPFKGLVCTTEAAAESITTADAKTFLRVDTSDDDTLIASLITAARLYLEGRTNRIFSDTHYTLYLDSFPDEIVIPVAPVTSITITYYNSAGTITTLSSSLYQTLRGEPTCIVPAYNQTWPTTQDKPDAVMVSFVAGHGETGTLALPGCYRQALLMMVAHLYRNREAVTNEELMDVPMGIESLIQLNRVSPTT